MALEPKVISDQVLRGSNLTHNLMSEIGNQIDDLLLPYKVDLSLYPTLSPDVKDHIQRAGQSFYQK